MDTVREYFYNDVQLGSVASGAEDRIVQSLALPRSAVKQRERREFWQGFITALFDHDLISHDEYRWLRDKVVSAN